MIKLSTTENREQAALRQVCPGERSLEVRGCRGLRWAIGKQGPSPYIDIGLTRWRGVLVFVRVQFGHICRRVAAGSEFYSPKISPDHSRKASVVRRNLNFRAVFKTLALRGDFA